MLNRVLGGVGRVLIFSGVVLLLWVAFTLWGTSFYEAGEQSDLTAALATSLGTGAGAPKADDRDDPAAVARALANIDPSTVEAVAAPPEGEGLGFIEIPKIGLAARVIVEGVAKADLRKGPGHYPGTPMPGQKGNAAIAGHRTTYGAPFNRIDELLPGDRITTYTRQGKFVYEVMAPTGSGGIERGPGWFSVLPTDGSVIGPTTDNRLTLTACHPKYSARQRIVVQAKLVSDIAPTAPTTTIDGGTGGDDREPSSAVDETDALIAGDPSEKTPALAWGAGFILLWVAMWFVAARLASMERRAWLPLALGAPLSLVPLWICFTHLDRFLPSF